MLKTFLTILFCSAFCFTACAQTPTRTARTANNTQIGGIGFAPNGTLAAWQIGASGTDTLSSQVPVWSFQVERNGQVSNFPVNGIRITNVSANGANLELSASGLPQGTANVSVNRDTSAFRFTVRDVANRDITGISLQIPLDDSFDCQIGFAPYSPFHHSCSSQRGVIASFCATGNCNNIIQYTPTLVPQIGAILTRTPLLELPNSSFYLFSSNKPYQSLEFAREFEVFRNRFGNRSETDSAIFFTSLPNVAGANCAPNEICQPRLRAAADIARRSGFGEVILDGTIWQNSSGEFDTKRDFAQSMQTLRNGGLCPVLHMLSSEVYPSNPLCNGANCPTGAAKMNAPNQPYINPYGTNYLWDGNKGAVFDRVTRSHSEGVLRNGACGIYADGADWFGLIHPLLGASYLAELSQRAPQMRLRSAISGSPSALYQRDVDLTDMWQVSNSRTPKDWVFNWGFYNLQSLYSHLGMSSRLGWIPPPRTTDSPNDYLPLFNAAVANGSHLTIETVGDDAAWTNASFNWFRTSLRETIDALREIRRGQSAGAFGERTARFEVLNFTNGVSTVALFNSIIPAGGNSRLEGRSYGLRSDAGTVCRNSSVPQQNRCFYFKGTPRMPSAPNSPRLTDGGSFIYAPPDEALKTKDFTLSLWFKSEGGNAPTGGLIEKPTFGYGIFLANGTVGGHLTGSIMGSFLQNPYFPLESAQNWNHFTYIYSERTRSVRNFLNGKLVLEYPLGNAPPARIFFESPLFVGTTGDAFANFRGWISDVKILNRAATNEEAIAIFQNKFSGESVVSWNADTPAKSSTILEIDLKNQRTVYLVPMLEGNSLPSSKIRLKFTGFNNRAAAAKIQTTLSHRRINSDGNTLIVEVDSNSVGSKFQRISIN